MKKAVIFDIDDTLIDFVERKKLIIRESVKAMIDAGINEDFDKLHDDFSDFYWKTGIEDQRIFEKYFMHKYGKIDYKVLAYAIIAYRKTSTGLLRPFPGAKSVLVYLKEKGLKLAILSDAPKLEAYLRICGVGLDDFFDIIITKDDTSVTKPDKKGFLMVAEKLGVKPEECVMIGDKFFKDVAGAKALGMTTIHAKYGWCNEDFNEVKVHADYTAEKITDVKEIIDKLM